MKGPVEPVHRSVPETIQEVIELTGFLCFLFRSTPIINILIRGAGLRGTSVCFRSKSSPSTCAGSSQGFETHSPR